MPDRGLAVSPPVPPPAPTPRVHRERFFKVSDDPTSDEAWYFVRFSASPDVPLFVVEWQAWKVFWSVPVVDGGVVGGLKLHEHGTFIGHSGAAMDHPAEMEFEGSVRADGCSNWSTHGTAHACCRGNLDDVGTLLARVYDESAAILAALRNNPAGLDAEPVVVDDLPSGEKQVVFESRDDIELQQTIDGGCKACGATFAHSGALVHIPPCVGAVPGGVYRPEVKP